jgi:hypothetical protein
MYVITRFKVLLGIIFQSIYMYVVTRFKLLLGIMFQTEVVKF